jgi:hypothetical protein
MRLCLRLNLLFAICLLSYSAYAHELGAHVHGVAILQIAVDQKLVTVDFSSPLDNLIGFEHKPNNDQQKLAVQDMVKTFSSPVQLFILPKTAQCTLKSTTLKSLVIDSKDPRENQDEPAGHADLDAEFIFTCSNTDKANGMQVSLFKRYQNLHMINAQVATNHGQTASQLTPSKTQISW